MSINQISYLELPGTALAALPTFYRDLFGWSFENWGEDYATVHGSGLETGINADAASRSQAPLAMVETDEIEAMAVRVAAAGGSVTVPIFSYPGGRRFHFLDLYGNQLAVFQPGP